MRVVVGITGASGAAYAVSLVENLKKRGVNVALIVSEHGEQLIGFETQLSPDDAKHLADDVYENDDLAADIASGSNRFDAFVIVPCSMSTLSKIACGIGDNLITRVALDAVILPAMPGFYHKPRGLEDIVNFIVGKIMEQLGLEHGLYDSWKTENTNESR
jgi:4-hydroxy-3-polyprenylbenzoate decarboxylase